MNVQIQSVKFDADKRLIGIRECQDGEVGPLCGNASTGAEVILKLDKDHEKGNKFATITLHMLARTWWPATSRKPSKSRSMKPSTP